MKFKKKILINHQILFNIINHQILFNIIKLQIISEKINDITINNNHIKNEGEYRDY